jgi:hypothetical protein
MIDAQASALIVSGKLSLHGEASTLWQNLIYNAFAGEDFVFVNGGTWVVGDVITITSSNGDATQSETCVVVSSENATTNDADYARKVEEEAKGIELGTTAAISEDRVFSTPLKIKLDRALAHYHSGVNPADINGHTVQMSAEVY